MIYLVVGLIVGVITSTPALFRGQMLLALVSGAIATLFWSIVFYVGEVGFAGPMFGSMMFAMAISATIVAVIAGIAEDRFSAPVVIVPVIAWAAIVAILFFGSDMLNADKYRALIGDMEKRVWTQDIQPKDPQHFRAVSIDNALYITRKVVGELGTVGSQFQISEESMTLQTIKGELWYVVPIDFTGLRAWMSAGSSLGYIMVHAEDPNRQPIVKSLPKEKQFVYTPGAFFGNNLIRHLHLSGYLRSELNGTHLELDDDGSPWWITSVLIPTIGQFGYKVEGVLVTNPVTGESKFFELGSIPHWVDRVIPSKIVSNYLYYWGEYIHGWWNSWASKRDLTEPEIPSIIYGSNHEPMFVLGITSQNLRDDSLVGVVYINTRTGKSVFYEVKGGATDGAVISAIANHQDVQFKRLHPKNPQLYNLYGTMASIAPLVNDNYAYSGVAIANINNVQQVVVGRSLSEAVRLYQRQLGQTGDLAHLERENKLIVAEGVIERIKTDITSTGSVYYLVIKGSSHAFVGSSGEFPFIPLAQSGDRVKVEYVASGEAIVPMHSFSNLSLGLKKSAGEIEVGARKESSRAENEAKPVRQGLEQKIKNASPDELKKLEKALQ